MPRYRRRDRKKGMFERLKEDINSVFHRDPAARNTFEVLTNYPGND